MKKIIILILILFITTGCTDYRELTDMAIISNVALDKVDDKYNIIIQVLDSKKNENGSSNPSIVLYQSSGKTLFEAFRNISLESSKKLYTGHINTFIVTENLLNEGASNFIDFVLRNSEIRKDFNLLITNNNINEIMNIIPPLSIPSEKITNSLEISSKYQGMVDIISFDKFISNIYTVGIDPVLPSLEIKNIKSDDEDINPTKRLVLKKEMGIFNDDIFKGYISKDASLGLNILNNKDTSSIITFKCDNKNYSSVELINAIPKLTVDINSNKLYIELNITATLDELNCNIDITNDNGINLLKDKFNNRVYEILKSTIKEQKDKNVDYLGIGRYIYQNNYKFYELNQDDIDNIITNLNESININTTFTEKTTIRNGDEKY